MVHEISFDRYRSPTTEKQHLIPVTIVSAVMISCAIAFDNSGERTSLYYEQAAEIVCGSGGSR
jgi:hypothetical protein